MIRAHLSVLPLTAAAFLISACTTGPVVQQDGTTNKTASGAAIGTVAGALAGRAIAGSSSVGDRNKSVVLGAITGAAVGAAIGNRLDKQEAELRESLGNSATIQNTGESLIVTMSQDILFATNSADLRSGLVDELRSVGANLQAYPDTSVQVIGHTDNTGDAGYNQSLSQRRAQSVTNVLLSQGVASYRIQTIGRGEDAPIASNLTAEGRAQNRRVEIIIVPNA